MISADPPFISPDFTAYPNLIMGIFGAPVSAWTEFSLRSEIERFRTFLTRDQQSEFYNHIYSIIFCRPADPIYRHELCRKGESFAKNQAADLRTLLLATSVELLRKQGQLKALIDLATTPDFKPETWVDLTNIPSDLTLPALDKVIEQFFAQKALRSIPLLGAGAPSAPQPKKMKFSDLIAADNPYFLDSYRGNIHINNESGFNGLMLAALIKCPESLTWCIDHGVGRLNIDKKSEEEGLSALMLASHPRPFQKETKDPTDDPRCTTLLLKCGADPRVQAGGTGYTALHFAVYNNCLLTAKEICRFAVYRYRDLFDVRSFSFKNRDGILQRGDLTPLDLARLKNNKQMISLLENVESKKQAFALAPPKEYPPEVSINPTRFGSLIPRHLLEPTIACKGPQNTETLVRASKVLSSAVFNGRIETLSKLRPHIEIVDDKGRNIVMNAFLKGKIEVFKWYNDTTPEGTKTLLFTVDDSGNSPLHFTCTGEAPDDPSCIEDLLKAGVNPNAQNQRGFTPLHFAAASGRRKIVNYLLSQELCRLEITDRKGRTPAFYAKEGLHLDLAEEIEKKIEERRGLVG